MKSLYDYYTTQKSFWLCRCSLLVVYDGDADVTRSNVKLIDFAHNVTQVSVTYVWFMLFNIRAVPLGGRVGLIGG